MPSLWTNDVRLNALVSNHGVGTAGEPGIALVPDGHAGTFVIWEDAGVGVIRTQRLDTNGAAMWSSGVVSTNAAYQASPSAVSDSAGGLIAAWVDGRNGGCDSTSQMSCSLFVQRLDSTGARLWGDDALPVAVSARYPVANRFAMISDGAGGAYLAWSSGQDFYKCCSYYMQHIGPDGQPLWSVNGIRVSELPTVVTGPGVTGPRLIPDGSGGAILSWWNQQFEDGSRQLLAQRVASDGTLLWDPFGVTVPFSGFGHPNFDAVPDSAGGVIFAIQSSDMLNSANSHVYLQRISADGLVLWSSTGILVSSQIGAQLSPVLAADPAGGAFVAWSFGDPLLATSNGVLVQRADATGALRWTNEIPVTPLFRGQTAPRLLSDGNAGVIIAWEDCRTITDTGCASTFDLYAQRIDGHGQRIWTDEGFAISGAKGNQGIDYGNEKRPGFEMISDESGGFTFAWPDGRLKACSSSPADSCELYSQHLLP